MRADVLTVVAGIVTLVAAAGYLRRLLNRERPQHKREAKKKQRAARRPPKVDASFEVEASSELADRDEPAVIFRGGLEMSDGLGAEPEAVTELAGDRGRYANVAIVDARGQTPDFAPAGAVAHVELSLGPLRPDSLVRAPVPFPDDVLPDDDLVLDVLFSSPDLAVGHTTADLRDQATAVEAKLLLPRDGGPATTPLGEHILRFAFRLPERAGRSRARVTYLYNNVAVQSQRIDVTTRSRRDDADAGHRLRHRFEAETDYTLSRTLDAEHLEACAPRNRVTIVMNETGAAHHVTVRATDEHGAQPATAAAFVLGDGVEVATRRIREALHDSAPPTEARSRRDLVADLRRLAPLGWQLHAALPPEVVDFARRAEEAPGLCVLEVVLPRGATFTLPWNLVYSTYLDSSVPVERIPVCPGIQEWDEHAPLVDGEPRRCPHADTVDHVENLLCPFGFWGFRHSLELLVSAESPKRTVSLRAPRVVIGHGTGRGIKPDALAEHVGELTGVFSEAIPGVTVTSVDTKTDLRAAVSDDLPFLYLLCHGDEYDDAMPMLTVGRDETITPADLNGWVEVVWARSGRRMWTDPQPMVFVNACASLAISPEHLVDYLGAFVGRANASALVGTEARVSQKVAARFAERFFTEFLKPDTTLEVALHRTKIAALGQGNLVGLAYTPYGLADLQVAWP